MCSITEIRNNLKIPTLHSRRTLFAAIKVFGIIHNTNNITNDLQYTKLKLRQCSRNLRSNVQGLLDIPKYNKTNFGQRSFNYTGPKLWNNLPPEIRNIELRSEFKRRVKEYLIKYNWG